MAKNTNLGIRCLNSKSKFSKPQRLSLGKVPRPLLALIPIVLREIMEYNSVGCMTCNSKSQPVLLLFAIVTVTVVVMVIVEVWTISRCSKSCTCVLPLADFMV